MTSYLGRYQRAQDHHSKKNLFHPQSGEVWFASNIDGIKDRPILIVSSSGTEVVYRKCTTKPNDIRGRSLIEDYVSAGLEKDTYVDPEPKIISKSRLLWKMGTLSPEDMTQFGL